MAVIHEKLVLEDSFSPQFARYISLGQKAAGASTMAANAARNYQAVANTLDRRLITLNAQFTAGVNRQQDMIRAGKQNTQAFTTLDAKLEKLGGTIRDLEAQYSALTPKMEAAQKEAAKFSESQSKVSSSLMSSIRNLVGAYIGLQGLSGIVNLSDTMTLNTARLNMMNDGLQDTAELNNMIYQSAQRARAPYQSMTELVSKMGTLAGSAFNSTQEIVDFSEQVYKQMALSGASTQASNAAMLQLTQAMSSGVLRGEELNSILEQTPVIAQSIASYMGVSVGTMRNLASEGTITAEVVKNAMLNSTNEINQKFSQIPMTWAQVFTSAQNTAIMATQPILNAINFAANNLDILIPIVGTAGAAFGIFLLAANWVKICTGATNTLANAQKMLKAVMATSWGLPLIIIVSVVGGIYLVVAAVNKLTGTTLSATGIITGAVATGAAFIGNVAIGLFNGIIQAVWSIFVTPFISLIEFALNVANGGFNSFGDAVANLVGNIIGWFLDLGKVVTTIVDAIFGTNWTSGLTSLQSSVLSWGKNEKAITLDRSATPILDYRFSYSNAWDKGYDFGKNLLSFSSAFTPSTDTFSGYDNIPTYDQISDLNSAVGSIEKAVNLSEEDLKSLVDVAERRYVNNINLTAQTPVINITGQNTGNTPADRQNLANAIRDILIEQVAAGSTRSTAVAF